MAEVIHYIGTLRQVGEKLTMGELTTREISVVGRFDDIRSEIVQGEEMAGGGFVRSVDITVEEGGLARGTATLVDVEGSEDGKRYYGTTWEIDIREVVKSLKTHPSIGTETLDIIRRWEASPEGTRVRYGAGGGRTYYITEYDDDGGVVGTVEVADEVAIRYLDAYTAGIETYNVYLPVVRRTRYFIDRPPSGITGVFEPPDGLSLKNFDDGGFFRSADKISKLADGSWTRTEEWTFTNDASHRWIYENVHEDEERE